MASAASGLRSRHARLRWHSSATHPCDTGKGARPIRQIGEIRAPHMLRQRCTGRSGEPIDKFYQRSFTRKWQPIIIKAGKLHADQQTGLLDIHETKVAPQIRHLIWLAQWRERTPLDRRIENCGDIPHHMHVWRPAVSIPHHCCHVPLGLTTQHISATAWARVGRNWDELQYEHGEGAIERIILERQGTGIRLLEADPQVGIAGTRELDTGFGQVNSGDARDVGNFGKRERQAAGPAADVEHTVIVRKVSVRSWP